MRFAPDGSLYVVLRNAWVIDGKFEGGTGSLLRIRPTTALGAKGPAVLGPKPGDVYREYAIHNGGNFDWRVTDPRAKHEGAKTFLPNPVLTINVRDLKGAIRAEAVLDRWGGHAGTKDKLIRLNDNEWITLPELTTTPKGHMLEVLWPGPAVTVRYRKDSHSVRELHGAVNVAILESCAN
jgi:hypothetical protein